MNTELLYELYEITEKNDAPDLATVGMPMLLKKHPEITHEEAKEMREFTAPWARSWPPPSLTRRHLSPPLRLASRPTKRPPSQAEQEHE